MTKRVMMTAARQRALELAKTGPITTNDIAKDSGIKLSSATNLLYGMVESGLLVRERKDRNRSVAFEYSLPDPSAQPEQPKLPLPPVKTSISPPTAKSLWEQIEGVLSTTTRMSLQDIVKAGVPHDPRLHRMLKEMYSAGKIARWLAGDHYVYTLANALQPATAKLKDFVPAETFKKESTALDEVISELEAEPDVPVIGENVLGEMALLREELERTRKELSDARERLKVHNTYTVTLPKLLSGPAWDDFYAGAVAKLDYAGAMSILNELKAQLEA